MKNLILLFFLCVFIFSGFAQKADSSKSSVGLNLNSIAGALFDSDYPLFSVNYKKSLNDKYRFRTSFNLIISSYEDSYLGIEEDRLTVTDIWSSRKYYDVRFGIEKTVYKKNKLSCFLYLDLLTGVQKNNLSYQIWYVDAAPEEGHPYFDDSWIPKRYIGYAGGSLGAAIQYRLNESFSASMNMNLNVGVNFDDKSVNDITSDFFRFQLNYHFN